MLALIMAGCPRSSPPITPSVTPPSRTATVEAELRALAEARAHFEAGRFQTASRLLRHFLELHAHTANAVEARWILGRSYEELGEWHAALAQYRIIVAAAAHPPGLPPALNTQVRDRISVLTRVLGRATSATSGFVAIALDPAHLPDPARWEEWLTPLLAEGITTLVLDVAPVSRQTASGVYFRTTWARLDRDLFTELIPLAHDLGLTVFASLDLTQMPWLDPTLGWTTYVLDERTRQLTPTRSFDVLHPAVQEYLTGFLSDLARTQVDGLIALFGSRNGPRYHISGKGLAQFAQSVGADLDPVQVLSYAHTIPVHGHSITPTAPSSDPIAGYFWRWAGWQAREQLNVLDRFRAAMRRQHTGLHVAIAFHDVSLTNSPIGLLEHGEDLLEAASRGFGVALPLAALSPQATTGPGSPSGSAFADQVTRTLDYVGSAERLWLLEPVSHLDRASLSRLLNAPQVQILRSRGINLVITAPTP
ncbi:hypothetical protein YTPLAS18_21940 [Nitrospira sp.]|nr:hypothetical protein YTPLAS18_21940 [Nitrospira sp.]